MTDRRWRLALAGLVAATFVVGAACSSDEGEDEEPEATATSTATPTESAMGTGEATAAAAMTETATATEATGVGALGLADLDGLVCSGQWTNQTFGSTGSFAATFSTGDGGGSVKLELGGNVFGGQGGTVDAPFTTDGETTVFDADLGFLGMAMMSFDGTTVGEAVLQNPPALGEGSKATVTDFAFDGKTLNAGLDIEFANNGGTAHSILESTCE